ncbi:hypothetical protein SAMN02799620_02017 [Mycolicibacterium fluoranthenivorans]|uniref:DUF732 domain-containing protein n=2 Tax=Mycolicibacterium fluoranthenivorans TaxID=258505 RepID=A0A1G4W1E3_9MYCO|nr:hypothetical protein SAMN02799620_02017 [Mycolicibacterium fluoranthenivorans]
MVCNEGLAHGVGWREIRARMIGWGYSVWASSLVIANATFTYCPEHREVADEIQADDLFRRSSG